ncbi:FMN-binding protein MioC [Psychromonas sp. 14N.309.X.WAT.B.A12]|uniref:FMN-binding protein MioC n=1 Tax=unclassified Psychromonas TaxID=2614957 RepID=UPI0025B1F926|nr:FMN-binding protein MioC [Psychromonas sp. 14N.309.X.WAT.B.A12]MDN2664727.1 FMN-binding protein MioC [Psychromonas sp. 14N.309.X.WAT.B.A12]
MSNIDILVGSTLGATEYVAEATQPILEKAGFTTEIHFIPNIEVLDVTSEQLWLICISTHGAGDYPDNFKVFANQIDQLDKQALTNIRFGLVGVGDSNYDTYCYAAKKLDLLLIAKGASRIGELFTIDVVESPIPEDKVIDWIPTWIKDLNNSAN